MLFHYISDIHLEMERDVSNGGDCISFSNIVGADGGDYIILAGDIGQIYVGRFQQFLQWCCMGWKRVFYVTGNHEYYVSHRMGWDFAQVEKEMENMFRSDPELSNLHWLRGGEVIDIPDTDLSVVGCTLWTEIPDDRLIEARACMNDYNLIHLIGARLMRPVDSRAMHRLQKRILQSCIRDATSRGRRVIVITHHMPSYSLIAPKWRGSSINCCFASDCDNLIKEKGVVAWFYGHTHMRGKVSIGQCECMVNAVGYPGTERWHLGSLREHVWSA